MPAHLQQRPAVGLLCRFQPATASPASGCGSSGALGHSGEWLRAICADVPMAINAPGLRRRTIRSTQGLKQGCPLRPTLFSLYIADWEQHVSAA